MDIQEKLADVVWFVSVYNITNSKIVNQQEKALNWAFSFGPINKGMHYPKGFI